MISAAMRHTRAVFGARIFCVLFIFVNFEFSEELHNFLENRNRQKVTWQPVNLDKIQRSVEAGRLDPSNIVTMASLRSAGIIGKKVEHGVKLLGKVEFLLGSFPPAREVCEGHPSSVSGS
jgi:Ribosomal proteins 50S-L15, 50S-L18e, 60S-L27A